MNLNEFRENESEWLFIYFKIRNFSWKQPCEIQNRKEGPQDVHGIRAAKVNICCTQHGEEHTLCLRVALDDAQGQKIHFDCLTCTGQWLLHKITAL